MKHALLFVVAIVSSAAVTPARAQPQTAPAPPAAQAQSVEPEGTRAAELPYSYNPEGRRDPFLSLLGRGNEPLAMGARPPGIAGLLIAEVTVKGTLRDQSGFIALVQSPENKTYMIRTGDRLLDGSVKAIGQDKVIFSQDVTDPLSLVKQREVPKAVRPADGRDARPVS